MTNALTGLNITDLNNGKKPENINDKIIAKFHPENTFVTISISSDKSKMMISDEYNGVSLIDLSDFSSYDINYFPKDLLDNKIGEFKLGDAHSTSFSYLGEFFFINTKSKFLNLLLFNIYIKVYFTINFKNIINYIFITKKSSWSKSLEILFRN